MKKFLLSALGALAAIWFSVLLFGLLFIVLLVAIVVGSADKSSLELQSNSVLRIELAGTVTDRAEPVKLMDKIYDRDVTYIPLNDLVNAITVAATDNKIKGIYLECSGMTVGTAQLQTIADALKKFKESGKWIYAYADTYTQADYFIATQADSIFINPVGMVDIHGLSATTLYFKDLLDKVGIDMQVVKVGTYKSAVEPYLLNEMSPANREQQMVYLGNIWNVISDQIAVNRKVTQEKVNEWADQFVYTLDAADYVKEKIVDRLMYRHEMEEMLKTTLGLEKKEIINFVDYAEYAKAFGDKATSKGNKKAKIALLYAVGEIADTGSDGITAEKLVPQILELAEDENIDALVMRVNSPGGSAFASEQIWEALQQYKAISGKPFYVSMGDYAASGGYYIACGADCIYADPLTLTGSIGIFGVIPSAQKLLNDKLGVHTGTVSTNKGDFPTIFNSMNEQQRAAMQGYVNRGYELFTKRCAEGRHMSQDSIKAIAEGRVWDGKSAVELGLVDHLGGLDQAIAAVAAKIDCADNYEIAEYPVLKFKWWEEVLNASADFETRFVDKELGETARYYRAARRFTEMSPLQCRMDYVEIR